MAQPVALSCCSHEIGTSVDDDPEPVVSTLVEVPPDDELSPDV